MEYRELFGHRCSRLVLGTAQLGLAYGAVNRSGIPSHEEARRILAAAFDGGVTALDTAAAYGGSEEVIGRLLDAEPSWRASAFVVTKLDPLACADSLDDGALATAARESLARSRRLLGLARLPLVFFHRAAHPDLRGGLLRRVVEDEVGAGRVGAYGVSVYTPGEATAALANPGVRALQVPLNALDPRFVTSGVIAAAHARGVAVFARSVFLQGLLVAAPGAIPARIAPLREPIGRFSAMAARWGVSPAGAALSFARHFDAVDGILVGAETAAQVRDNLALLDDPPLDGRRVREIISAFDGLPEDLINPARWPRE